ncbi:HNH endonuclease [Alicyclobacillus ferrooxydans]|uniref:HNH endonuclease n=1 Tax=Alicyclobacillus ferrooxydans TaxID=471514 RepID=UPI0006D5491E
MTGSLGMCPRCKGYWRIRDLETANYACLHCGYQLKLGSVTPVRSARGKVLTPCTTERAEKEVAASRAYFDDAGTLWLYDAPELNARYRDIVFRRDHATCLWCGQPADTVDHIIPYSEGGVYHPVNLLCACRHCNQRRQNEEAFRFLEILAGCGTPSPYADYVVERYALACAIVPRVKHRRTDLPNE